MKKVSPSEVVVILLILLTNVGFANDSNKSSFFQNLEIGFKFDKNINRNTFHKFWRPEQGIEGFVETLFYYGHVQIGLQFIPYTSKSHQIPNYNSVYFSLGYGKEWTLPLGIYWFNCVKIGNYLMIFEYGEFGDPSKTESEFSSGLMSRMSYQIHKKLRINISTSYMVIYTYKRIELTFISLGTSYSIKTPKWIQDFLK